VDIEHIVRRIRSEFLEMPGLQLTVRQASRLWGLERSVCESLIESLVACAFLRRTATGLIVRNEA
jgi:hypothetical protein